MSSSPATHALAAVGARPGRLATWMAAVAVGTLGCAAATAGPLTHHGFSTAGSTNVSVASPFNGATVGAAAGAFRVTWGGGTFLTYCVELTQYAAIGQTHDYTLVDGTEYFGTLVPGLASRGGSAAVVVERLDRLFTALGGLGLPAAGALGAVAYTAAQASAAIQLAVWETVYEGYAGGARLDGLNLAGGAFRETGTQRSAGQVRDLADSMLASAASLSAGHFDIAVLHSPHHQDYLLVTRRPVREEGRAVPVPGTLALAVLGLALVGGQRARRSSVSAAAPISPNSAKLQNS